jgi:hypothetical protein
MNKEVQKKNNIYAFNKIFSTILIQLSLTKLLTE